MGLSSRRVLVDSDLNPALAGTKGNSDMIHQLLHVRDATRSGCDHQVRGVVRGIHRTDRVVRAIHRTDHVVRVIQGADGVG